MELDPTRLRYLLTIARTASFARAAEELHVTQPALSRSVASIEERYGFRLFDRSRQGVMPTAVGAKVLADAELLLRDSRLLAENMRLYGRGEAGRVAIGMGPLIASLILSSLGADMLTARPQLQIRCSIKAPEVLVQELKNLEIEVMLCSRATVAPAAELATRTLGRVALGMFVRAGHPLAGNEQLSLESLRGRPYACAVELQSHHLPGSGGALICDNYEILRNVVLRSDTVWLSSAQMVAADLAEGRLVELPITDLPFQPDDIAAVWLKQRTISPAAQAIIAHAETLLRST